MVVLAVAFATGLTGAPEEVTTAAGPRTVLARDRRTFWIAGLSSAMATGLVTWLVAALAVTLKSGTGSAATPAHGFPAGPGDGLGDEIAIGLADAFWVALMFSFLQAAWGSLTVAQCWLALRRRLPLRLMGFLADAHEQRGVLRQVGAVYQFRHAELQRRLATRANQQGRHRRPGGRRGRTRSSAPARPPRSAG
jgi:hypothetical protein